MIPYLGIPPKKRRIIGEGCKGSQEENEQNNANDVQIVAGTEALNDIEINGMYLWNIKKLGIVVKILNLKVNKHQAT